MIIHRIGQYLTRLLSWLPSLGINPLWIHFSFQNWPLLVVPEENGRLGQSLLKLWPLLICVIVVMWIELGLMLINAICRQIVHQKEGILTMNLITVQEHILLNIVHVLSINLGRDGLFFSNHVLVTVELVLRTYFDRVLESKAFG